jgi:hypothetical protein
MAKETVTASPYIDADAAARYLHFATGDYLVRKLDRLGIPHRKSGRRFLFLPAELDVWLAARTSEYEKTRKRRTTKGSPRKRRQTKRRTH